MRTERKQVSELHCEEDKYNKYEVQHYKTVYDKGQGIPLPIVDVDDRVIGFYSCFFALKELGIESSGVLIIK